MSKIQPDPRRYLTVEDSILYFWEFNEETKAFEQKASAKFKTRAEAEAFYQTALKRRLRFYL